MTTPRTPGIERLVIQIYEPAVRGDVLATRLHPECWAPLRRPLRSRTAPGPASDEEVIGIVIGRGIVRAGIDPVDFNRQADDLSPGDVYISAVR